MCGVLAICALTLLALSHADVIVYTQQRPHTIEQEFHDMPASFGPELPFEGLRGLLAAGEPRDGCTALAPPPLAENFTGKWIVLLARYNCSFEVKVRNAQTAGYDCAIVHNVNSSALETMSAQDPSGIKIPSVFVSDFAGQVLAEEFLYSQGYYIMVNGEMPFNINTHLLLPFAIIVALCFVILVVLMIIKCIKDRQRARRHRLPNRALKKIPTCKFAKGDPYDTCAICLDDYQEGERLRVLPCSHAYHAKCIDPWLTQNRRVCPVCKRRVLAAGERRAPASDSDSDDSREPLVSPVEAPRSQGGTFEPQRENPFVRASRFMSRLRSRPQPETHTETMAPEEAPAPVDFDTTQQEQSEQPDDDTAPLIRPSVSQESERRRGRRGRRTRSAGEPRAVRRPPNPVIRSANHSINANRERGEIGVAALPAAVNSTLATPDHIHL